ncbi:MAG: ATP-binding protein [Clostridiales bacterium]|jgi:DNA replication protein DnaC|nr:ATP-binding protein [Clostridiales bacterium]
MERKNTERMAPMERGAVYNAIRRELAQDRMNAERAARERREKAYADNPRLSEVASDLAKACLSAAKLVASGNEKDAKKTMRLADDLRTERDALLKAAGLNGDYFEAAYKCGVCKDVGYVDGRKCRCFVQRLVRRFYSAANIGDIIEAENFSTFDLRYYDDAPVYENGKTPQSAIQDILGRCLDFTDNFDVKFQNLLFYGDTGLGKTFLCNCIAKRMIDAGKTVLYVTAPRIFKKIEELRFNRDNMEAPDDQLDMIYSADLLIIDDLGSEFSTILTSAELFNVINGRLLEKKPSVISTNLSLNDLQSVYSDRIVSRLFGAYSMLRFFGDDIRLKKKYAAPKAR